MALLKREEIHKYVLNSLGSPIVAVELATEQIDEAITVALDEYLSVGAFERAYGIISTTPGINDYALPPEVGTVTSVVYAMPFQTVAGSAQDIFSFAVYSSPLGPNFTNFIHAAGNIGLFYEYLQNRNRVIGNDITFKQMDQKLYVWPFPKTGEPMIIEYAKNTFGVQDKDGAISLSNSWGSNWIRKYALALCKGMLGKIRGKYSNVAAGPAEAQTLNGAELVAESKEEIAILKEDLMGQISHAQIYFE